MVENFDEYPDRIAQTFANKTVLLTGGTGFVGKVLLEKLLRSCPAVGKVYVLVRSKKEKEPHLRLKEVFKDPIFDSLKKQHDLEVFSKVEAVSGDVSAPNLSLSHYDCGRICAEVEIIYHCAALVRFDIPLRDAVFTNVRGTKLMLELAKKCKKLLIFNHVSTAYCHLDQKVLHERTYPPPTDPDGIIKICECMDNDIVESIKNKLLDQFPNCYPFTKALSEGLVSREMEALPVVIFRPSVVVPIWREPMPGYTDNINGPTGLLIGAAKGVVRSMYCKGDGYLDYIPADIVANGLLFTTYDYLNHKGERRVYNAVSSKEYQITFNEVIEMGKTVVATDLPFNMILWYPGGSLTQSRLKHFVSVVLFQLFPALFVDWLLIFLRQKPFLMKVQKRILSAYKLCEYYVNRNWDFNNDNTLKAIQKLNPRERRTYKLDGTGGNFREYFTNCVHSARLYLVKEGDDQIPAAKRQMKVMWFVDWFFKILIVTALAYFVWNKVC